MMLSLKPAILLFCAFVFFACSPRSGIADNSASTEEQEEQNPNKKETMKIILEESPTKHTSDSFNVESVSLGGDILEITVSYGGGCKDHEWKMYSSKMVAKSYPPKLDIFLEHKSNQDLCKALIRETLKFDLTSIQYSGSEILHLQMNNYDEFIVYTY